MANRPSGEKEMKRFHKTSGSYGDRDEPASKRPRKDTPKFAYGHRHHEAKGKDEIPDDISVSTFAERRAEELTALTRAVEEMGGTKLAFQRLPHHMRRRAMSHNIRRVPRKLRQKVQAELIRRDKKGVPKRSSRRHRRRPRSLFSEYMRRQRQNVWLETHIWHAKRFKMTTAWGYRLPLHPSSKSLRACYRATTKSCLLQDVSYECCIEIRGSRATILQALKHVTSADVGVTFGAKVTSSGQKWGEVILYTCDAYPWGAVAPVTYFWKPATEKEAVSEQGNEAENKQSVLWIWSHPASYVPVWTQLQTACSLVAGKEVTGSCSNEDAGDKLTWNPVQTTEPLEAEKDGVVVNIQYTKGGQEIDSLVNPSGAGDSLLENMSVAKTCSEAERCGTVINQQTKAFVKNGGTGKSCLPGGTVLQVGELTLSSLKDQLVRFRLTGPAATRVLVETVQLADILSTAQSGGDGNHYAPLLVPGITAASVEDTRLDKDKVQISEEKVQNVKWWQCFYKSPRAVLNFKTQQTVWRHLAKCHSPGNFPPRVMIALTICDPRLHVPSKRINVELQETESAETPLRWEEIPSAAALSPLWEADVRHSVVATKLSEKEINQRRSQLLVPGSQLHLGDDESRVPILLLQLPGVQPASGSTTRETAATTCVGFGSGWDVVAPRGWGMALWVGFAYRGARTGGLREACSTYARAGALHFPCDFPDTYAGEDYNQAGGKDLEEKHMKRPPAKRCSYTRLGVPAPFFHPFGQLVSEWHQKFYEGINKGSSSLGLLAVGAQICPKAQTCDLQELDIGGPSPESSGDVTSKATMGLCRAPGQGFYVLRNKHLLRTLSKTVQSLKSAHLQSQDGAVNLTLLEAMMKQQQFKNAISDHLLSLVPMVIVPLLRGNPAKNAMICIPSTEDLKILSENKQYGGPIESLHPRSVKSHKSKKKKKSRKKTASCSQSSKKQEKDPGHLKTCASDLPVCLLKACERPIIGFLTHGDFDLGRGHGSGTGFCSLLGLLTLLDSVHSNGPCVVLFRNPTSRQYRFASLSVVC